MGGWTNLKNAIANAIKANNNQEITGPILQVVLKSIVSNVGEHAAFAGFADTSTAPGAPDGIVFYVAGAGTYSNFSSVVIPDGGIGIITNASGDWALAGDTFFANLKDLPTGSSFAVCSNSNKTIHWTVTAPSYSLTGNTRLAIRMTNAPGSQIAPSAEFTLNINDTGEKPLVYAGKPATRNNSWNAGDTLDVFYAPDNNKYYAYPFMPYSEEVSALGNGVIDLQGQLNDLAQRVTALENK